MKLMIKLTEISTDDWNWYFMGQKLIYEGHSS